MFIAKYGDIRAWLVQKFIFENKNRVAMETINISKCSRVPGWHSTDLNSGLSLLPISAKKKTIYQNRRLRPKIEFRC